MMKIRTLLIALCLLVGAGVSAHDFSATVNGQRLYFTITNKAKKTVAVTYHGSIADQKHPVLSGTVEIPAKIRYNNVVYEVNAIGPKAFAHAQRLKGIVIPSGVETIGDFAFEHCDSLTSVVFPGNAVSLGQGIFFDCPAIAQVSIGSDWKSIDFAMFRWSRALTTVSIPAKVEKVQGVKKLKHLVAIVVDPNNARFSSVDGMLYNKDGSVYYACPRAYKGKVVIKEGVRSILSGALIDCVEVMAIDLPASVQQVSFRETSRMQALEYVVMRADKPIDTGYLHGTGKLLFQLANPKAQLIVPASSRKLYEQALASEAGEYAETTDGVPYTVSLAELPVKKNLKGVKNFNK